MKYMGWLRRLEILGKCEFDVKKLKGKYLQ
jgi:hypothetical protein